MWRSIKDWWTPARVVGFLFFTAGLSGTINGNIPYPSFVSLALVQFHQHISTTLLGMGLTVFTIDLANEHLAERQERKRLILKMGSPYNDNALEAVRELRSHGWGYDKDRSLERAILPGADLTNAKLAGFNLTDATLERAILCNADLIGARLQGANLIESDLQHADLEGADMSEAYLNGASLEFANLYQACITDAQLATTHALRYATMVDGNQYDGRFTLTGDIEAAKAQHIPINNSSAMEEWYRSPVLGPNENSEFSGA